MNDVSDDDWARTLSSEFPEPEMFMAGWNNGGNGEQRGGKPKYQHRENRGSIFDNDHKTTEKHPDFSGSANIGGVLYWVSGWAEMTKDNKRKLSLSFKVQEERRPEPSTPAPRATKGW